MEEKETWGRCLDYIDRNVDDKAFRTWFEPIQFGKFINEEGGKQLWLNFPNKVFIEYIQKEYTDLMRQAIANTFGDNVKVFYQISKSKEPTPSKETKAPATTAQDFDPQLNPDYTFANFIEGESNRLTRSIGKSIADHPEKTTFNPFFIFGPSGVGKTHLANAVGIRLRELHPQMRVLMVSTHVFTLQYTEATSHNNRNEFLNFYQSIDALIVDDIQELTTPKTQQIFFNIFNHLHQNRKIIIMTCDRPPVSLEGMEDRLLNRFKWGAIAEMERPNVELRLAILKAKIRKNGLKLPADVIEYIAENVSDNVRELEGIVNSMMALSIVENCEIDLPLATRVVARSVNLERKDFTVEDIVCHVCQHYGVKPKDITSNKRTRPVVQVRQLAMFLCKKYTGLSLSQIGLHIGKRDHSTVIHSCNLIEKRIAVDKKYRMEVEEVESTLKR